MPQLSKGTTYVTGGAVTAENLNALVDNATLVAGAITSQPAVSSVELADSLLVSQSGVLKKASFTQVQSAINPSLLGYLKADGSVAVTSSSQLILGTSAPIEPLHAASKGYADGLLAPYALKSGATFTGPVVLSANPTTSLEAATKQYVDAITERVLVSKLNSRQRSDTLQRQMVLTSSGGLITWGRTNNGATGTYWTDDRTLPQARPYFNVAIPSGVTITDFVCGPHSSLCLLSNGWVYSTGSNPQGQLGHGDTTDRSIFTRIEYFVSNSITISKIYHSGSRAGIYGVSMCISSTNELYSFGHNGNGALGISSTTNALTPTKVLIVLTVSQVAISDAYACSVMCIRPSGDLYSWGYNGQGQLGTGNTTQYTSAQLISSVGSVLKVDVTSGGSANTQGSSILLKANGDVYTTGYNAYGQLGLGDTTQRTSFTKVSSLSLITDIGISGGYAPTCYAVSTAKRLYTWGFNGYGQIGDNTTTNATSPYNVNKWAGNLAQDPPFVGKTFSVFISPGSNSYVTLCVIDSDGRIFLSGANNGMANGNNTSLLVFNEAVPTLGSATEKAVSAFIAQSDATLGLTILTNAGNVYSCGSNNYGFCSTGIVDSVPPYKYTFSRQMLYA